MATANSNLLRGFQWYVRQDGADGRAVRTLGHKAIVDVGGGELRATVDVVLDDGEGIAGRAVLWDGPDFADEDAPLIAYPFAAALQASFAGRTLTTIGVWQGRRQHAVEVSAFEALGRKADADRLFDSLWGDAQA